VQEATLALILIINRGLQIWTRDAPRIHDRLQSMLATEGVPTGGNVLARAWTGRRLRLPQARALGMVRKRRGIWDLAGKEAAVVGDSDADMGPAATRITGVRIAAAAGRSRSARRTISSNSPVARAALAWCLGSRWKAPRR
jgi:hypothetical protein